MENILIATDLAPENENVLDRAIQLAQFSKAKLHILHVFHTLRAPIINQRDVVEELNQRKEKTHALLERHESASHIEYDLHIADGGRVYDRVAEYAQNLHADMVIVGKSDRSKQTPSFVSTTTERICSETQAPVLVVCGESVQPYKDVIVRMDSPAVSETGLDLIAGFGPDIQVTLLQKTEKPANDGFIERIKRKSDGRKYQKFLREAKGLLAGYNLPEERLVSNDVDRLTTDALIKEAEEKNADLLVFKSRPSQRLAHKPDAFTRKLLEETPYDILAIGRG